MVLRSYCAQLSSLKLAGCRVTDDGLRAVLRACPQLRELCVTDSELISDASLQHMHEDSLLTREPPTPTHAHAHASTANATPVDTEPSVDPSSRAMVRQPSEMRRIAAM